MKKTIEVTYELNSRKIRSGETLTIAFLTDYHNSDSCGNDGRIMEILRGMSPDLVLCGGDMIVGRPGSPPDRAVALMQRIASEYPVYCGTGNHEYRAKIYPQQYGTLFEDYREPTAASGVHFLENQSETVTVRDTELLLCGFDADRQYYKRFHSPVLPVSELDRIFGAGDDPRYTILLAHNPRHLDTYLSWRADLTLCGHYHGGIMRFGRHTGAVSPDFRLFPHSAYGRFVRRGRTAIVSAGCGEHTIPVRMANPREVLRLVIRGRGRAENIYGDRSKTGGI